MGYLSGNKIPLTKSSINYIVKGLTRHFLTTKALQNHSSRIKLVISCRVKKSGPFWTRFSVQREVFSSRCPFFGPEGIFSHEARGRKKPKGPKLDSGRKKHSRRAEKKRPKYVPLFETRCRKLFIF